MSTVTDPIADLLARVRNAAAAQKPELFVPYSKIKAEVTRILKDEGYITDYAVDTGSRASANQDHEQDRESQQCDYRTKAGEPSRTPSLRRSQGDSKSPWGNGNFDSFNRHAEFCLAGKRRNKTWEASCWLTSGKRAFLYVTNWK
jgi:Ribosomal protein S8